MRLIFQSTKHSFFPSNFINRHLNSLSPITIHTINIHNNHSITINSHTNNNIISTRKFSIFPFTKSNEHPSTNKSNHHHQKYFSSKPDKKIDYYEMLGANKNDSEAEIKKAFYKMAKKWHPDANPSPEAKDKFSEINEAYQVLNNKEKRKQYDMYGHDSPQMNMSDFQDFAGFNLHDIFSQLFSSSNGNSNPFAGVFGGQQQQHDYTSPERGQELQIETHLTFMEAVKGCKKDIKIQRFDECSACDSSGMQPGSVPVKCVTCDGKGQTVTRMGSMIMQQTCHQCQGSGQSIHACSACQGSGLKSGNSVLDVDIPAGVDDGTRVRVANEGHCGRNHGGRGNAWLFCRVQKDKHFERDGSDVHIGVDVPVHVAILGGMVNVKTLTGEADVRIKPGTQSDHREVMRNKGIREPNSGRIGHQYLHFNVCIPADISERQKELLREFGDIQDSRIK